MGITPCRIHDKASFVFPYCFRICNRTFLIDDVFPTFSARYRRIDKFPITVVELGHDYIALELRLADLAFDATTVDSHISKVAQQLLCSVLTSNKSKQLWRVVNESSPASTINECWVGKQRSKERDIRLYSTDSKFN